MSRDFEAIAREIRDAQTKKQNERGTPYPKAAKAIGRALTESERHRFKEAWDRLMGKPPPGTGKRFAALEGKLAHRSGYHVENPDGLAASIGRHTYGEKAFQKMATEGAKRARARKAAIAKKRAFG